MVSGMAVSKRDRQVLDLKWHLCAYAYAEEDSTYLSSFRNANDTLDSNNSFIRASSAMITDARDSRLTTRSSERITQATDELQLEALLIPALMAVSSHGGNDFYILLCSRGSGLSDPLSALTCPLLLSLASFHRCFAFDHFL
jgi:hypothetical protein